MPHKGAEQFPDGIIPPFYRDFKNPQFKTGGLPKYIVTKNRLKDEGGDPAKIDKYFNHLKELSSHIEPEYIHQVLDHIIQPVETSTFSHDGRTYKKLAKLVELLRWLKSKHKNGYCMWTIHTAKDNGGEYIDRAEQIDICKSLADTMVVVKNDMYGFHGKRGRKKKESRNYALTLLVKTLIENANFNLENAIHQTEVLLMAHPQNCEKWDYNKIKAIVYRNPYINICNP